MRTCGGPSASLNRAFAAGRGGFNVACTSSKAPRQIMQATTRPRELLCHLRGDSEGSQRATGGLQAGERLLGALPEAKREPHTGQMGLQRSLLFIFEVKR